MEVSCRCPTCGHRVRFDPTDANTAGVICGSCQSTVPLEISDSLAGDNVVEVCPACHERAFYVQRDFNRNLGLGIVVLCALAGLIFVWFDRPVYFYLALGIGVLVDLILYWVLPDITICYTCKAVFKGVKKNPDHGPFDLHIADVLEGRSQG